MFEEVKEEREEDAQARERREDCEPGREASVRRRVEGVVEGGEEARYGLRVESGRQQVGHAASAGSS